MSGMKKRIEKSVKKKEASIYTYVLYLFTYSVCMKFYYQTLLLPESKKTK